MCRVSLTVWFLCKSCKLNFAKVDDYIEHKKQNHLTEFQVQNKSYVVFEEKIDGDFNNESGSVETKWINMREEFQLPNHSQIEIKSDPNPNIISCFTDPGLPWQIADITAQTIIYCSNPESNEDVLVPKTQVVTNGSELEEGEISLAGLFQLQHTPCVPVKRLTSKEIHAASRVTKPKWNLKNHPFVSRPFKCVFPNCGKAYVYQISLYAHKRSHSNARPFGCPQCNKTYKFRHYLVEHLRSHTGERPFKCPVDKCNKAFEKARVLGQHKRKVHCTSNEARHQLLEQRTSMEIQTEGASSSTTSKIKLKKNLKSRFVRRPFKCLIPNCGKVLASKSSLNLHKRSHSNARPFGCLHCDKTFKIRNKLVEHVRMHTGERPYKCPFKNCGKSFAKSTVFSSHKRHVHRIHSVKRTSQLLEDELQPANDSLERASSATGDRKRILKKRPKTHCIPRPFKCNQLDCGKTFPSKYSLRKHMKCHSDLRPFGCPHCDKTFKLRDQLVQHLSVHTRERPWKCPFDNCDKIYANARSLWRHKRNVHYTKS